MAQIDANRDVYLFTHGRRDLHSGAVKALVEMGFQESRIVAASPTKTGVVGDYMAMLWMPPKPDTIKIQQITKVDPVEPEGMIGLWKGVSRDDITSISLSGG